MWKPWAKQAFGCCLCHDFLSLCACVVCAMLVSMRAMMSPCVVSMGAPGQAQAARRVNLAEPSMDRRGTSGARSSGIDRGEGPPAPRPAPELVDLLERLGIDERNDGSGPRLVDQLVYLVPHVDLCRIHQLVDLCCLTDHDWAELGVPREKNLKLMEAVCGRVAEHAGVGPSRMTLLRVESMDMHHARLACMDRFACQGLPGSHCLAERTPCEAQTGAVTHRQGSAHGVASGPEQLQVTSEDAGPSLEGASEEAAQFVAAAVEAQRAALRSLNNALDAVRPSGRFSFAAATAVRGTSFAIDSLQCTPCTPEMAAQALTATSRALASCPQGPTYDVVLKAEQNVRELFVWTAQLKAPLGNERALVEVLRRAIGVSTIGVDTLSQLLHSHRQAVNKRFNKASLPPSSGRGKGRGR